MFFCLTDYLSSWNNPQLSSLVLVAHGKDDDEDWIVVITY